MATAPRKFQEKIALLNEKAAQGTAAFQQVMQEVSSLRNQPGLPNSYGADQCNYDYRRYDAPYMQNSQPFCDQKRNATSYQPTEQLTITPVHGGSLPDFTINLSPGRSQPYYSQGSVQGAMNDLQSLTQSCQTTGQMNPNLPNSVAFRGVSPVAQNGARRAVNHHVSPHRASHLTLPEMLSRSSSDSSLHQTAYQAKMASNSTTRKGSAPEERSRHQNLPYEMQKSFGNQFNVPEKQMYNAHNKNDHIQVPVSMQGQCLGGPSAGPGGGSLPDLTQVQYMQPVISTEGDNMSGSAHLNAALTSFNNGFDSYYPPSSRGTSPGPSPRLSPVFDRKQKPKPYSHPPPGQRLATVNKNHLSVPSVIKPHHFLTKAIVTDNSTIQPVDLANSGLSIPGAPLSPGSSHPSSPGSMPLMDYRNPRSPQISPCSSPVPPLNAQQTLQKFHCGSPDSRSAPQSPASLQQSPASPSMAKPFLYEGYTQAPGAQQLNHRFQQITVLDNPSGNQTYNQNIQAQLDQLESSSPIYYSPTGPVPITSFPQIPLSPTCSSPSPILDNLPSSPICGSQPNICSSPIAQTNQISSSHPSSPSHSPISPGTLSHHPETPQTPLTPNVALPRVVLTDHDGNDDKELLMNDVNELFVFDENMLKNLNSLGSMADDLMSVDQIRVDNEIEEGFRRDLRTYEQQGQEYHQQYMAQTNGISNSLQHSHTDLPQPNSPDKSTPLKITNLEPMIDPGESLGMESPLDSLSSSSPQDFAYNYPNQLDLDLNSFILAQTNPRL